MKKINILTASVLFLGCLAFFCNCGGGQNEVDEGYLPDWKRGMLDIHTISTGRGDAAFVIMPDGTSMMIDAGDNGKEKDRQHPDASLRPGEWQARYMKHFMRGLPGKGRLDYALVTHFHNDHIGSCLDTLPGENGYALSGITLVGELVPFAKLVDRDWPDYDFPSRQKVLGADKGFMEHYFKFIDYRRSKGMEAERFDVGSSSQFRMLYDADRYAGKFEIRNLAANGEVWTGEGTGSEKMYSGDPLLFDENMNSCAIRLRYGKFTYYNGGDLSGGNLDIYECPERDFETPVAKVCGKVNVMKANHHGYLDTCNEFFLRTLSPQNVIVDARSSNHPVPSTMSRMVDVLGEGTGFYVTVDQARKKLGEELWGHFKPWGHIVVRVYPGGTSYRIFVLDADSTDYRVIYESGLFEL
ncbi:MAG: ComEC/Rec2 family competence protein [Candidatus Cryptobacteroides sp.]